MIKRSKEPVNTQTVKNEVTVRADVDRELSLKYLGISYHGEPSAFLTSQTA